VGFFTSVAALAQTVSKALGLTQNSLSRPSRPLKQYYYNIRVLFLPKGVAKTQRVVGAFAPATARLRVQIAYAGPEIGFILMGPLRGAIWSLFFGSSVRSFKVKGDV